MNRLTSIVMAASLAPGGMLMMPAAHAADEPHAAIHEPAGENVQAAVKKAQAAIDKGLNYLKTQQKEDGGWQSAHEPPGFTSLVLRAFLRSPTYSANDPFVKKGIEKLLSYQAADGSISNDMLANYNTAIAISALAATKDPKYQPAIDKALGFLRNLQWSDTIEGVKNQSEKVTKDDPRFGGWGYGKHSRPDGSNLSIALDALHDAGVKPSDPAYQNAIVFVTRMQNRSESNDQPWAGDDGGFVYTPAKNGESPAGEYKGADGKRMLRSYGSMTYAGLKSLIYAGLSKEDPRVQAAWSWLMKHWTLGENPGMGVSDASNAQNGLYYYFMTMGRALDAYGQPVLVDAQGNHHDWRVELIDKVAGLQKDDGSWSGEKRWMEGDPVLVTAYSVLALEQAKQAIEQPAVGDALGKDSAAPKP